MADEEARRDPVEVAREELDAGRAWAARDRLTGCLAHRPADVEVLDLLAESWSALGEPAQAGRWWYLVDRDDGTADTARAAFTAEHDDDPLRVISALAVHAPLRAWPPAVRRRLQALADAAAARGERWTPGSRPSWRRPVPDSDEGWWFGAMMVVVLLAVVGVWLLGAVTLVRILLG